MSPKSSADDAKQQRLRRRLDELRQHLIGTDGRSRLIHVNLASSRRRSLTFRDQDADTVFKQLWESTSSQGLTFRATDAASPLAARQLQTGLEQTALDKRLLSIYRESRTAVLEHGMDVLYLALGFLKWYERNAPSVARTSPLILLPVTLERRKRGGYNIIARDEELEQNEPLMKRLRDDFKVTLPAATLDHEPPSVYFDRVQEAIADPEQDLQGEWTVLPDDAELGFFSFGKLRMYRDLDPTDGEWPDDYLEEHTLVQHLLGDGFDAPEAPVIDARTNLDDQLVSEKAHHVVDADNSQARVLEEVRQGRSVVIQGPPGTGKSQTITNIIASAVAEGKKVLFVAEKMAALEVVSSKLEKIGLKDLFLELHSKKATKSEVYGNLGDVLKPKVPERREGADFDEANDSRPLLREARDRLNRIVDTIHDPLNPGGYSGYDIMDVVSHFERADLAGGFELPGTEQFSAARVAELQQLISDWHDGLDQLGDLCAHPLRAIRSHALMPPYSESLGRPLLDLVEALEAYRDVCDEIEQSVGRFLRKTRLRQGASDLSELMRLLDDLPAFELGRYVAAMDILTNAPHEVDLHKLRQELKRRRKRRQRPAIRKLGELLRDCSVEQWSRDERQAIVHFLCHVGNLMEDNELSRRSLAPLAKDLGLVGCELNELRRGTTHDWETIVTWAAGVTALEPEGGAGRNLLDVLRAARACHDASPSVRERLDKTYKRCERTHRNAAKTLGMLTGAVVDFTNKEEDSIVDRWLEHKQMPGVIENLRTMLEAVEGYPGWADHLRRRESLIEAGLEPLVVYCETKQAPLQLVLDHFEYAIARARREEHITTDSSIGVLLHEKRDRLVQQFCEADEGGLSAARSYVSKGHLDAVPGGTVGSMATVRQETKKTTRHLAIRQFIRKTRDVLQEIKPVFLMSPASVAQYLPVGALKFDLVVFDEASQITPEDALGSILRAEANGQVVVVGDHQQLPPSRFFQRLTSDDADFDDDMDEEISPRLHENESILTMSEAQGLPIHMLTQHYRSKLPSLVEVSNREFYDSKVALPPSPIAKTEAVGLRLISVDGTYYPRGHGNNLANTNPAEADALCEALKAHARVQKELTVGIAALSKRQAILIEEQVELARREDDLLDAWMSEATESGEGVFIKNLENVQGDERDVIMISVGYGRRPDGDMTMNFGPINNPGGERRLNVLFTRARWRCDVYCSFDPSSINTSGATGEGRRVFKEYLTSAQSESFNQATIRGNIGETYIETDIAEEIVSLGYGVEQHVGPDGFVVELAVLNPSHPDEFMLAVETDGSTYRQALSARERDRMRCAILELYGWRYHRVWMTEWFYDRKNAIDKVREALESAKEEMRNGVRVVGSNQRPHEPDDDATVTAPRDPSPPDSDNPGYAEVPRYYKSIDDVPEEAIREAISWTTANNGELVHEDQVLEVRKRLGFKKTGIKIRRRIEEVLHGLGDQNETG